MAAIQNIESLPKTRFFSELPCIYLYQQLLCAEELAGIKTWDLGDIVDVTSTLQRSGKGDLFVDMNGVELLTKSPRPLLEKHKGLTDTEQYYRQHYVDLITNEHSHDVFRTRSKIIQGIGDYFLTRSRNADAAIDSRWCHCTPIRDPSQCARYRYVPAYRP